MINLKKKLLLFIFVFTTACGFSPLLNSEKINFYISDLKFEGDREVNKYILQEEIVNEILNSKTFDKFLKNNKIKKCFYVKNRLINFLI